MKFVVLLIADVSLCPSVSAIDFCLSATSLAQAMPDDATIERMRSEQYKAHGPVPTVPITTKEYSPTSITNTPVRLLFRMFVCFFFRVLRVILLFSFRFFKKTLNKSQYRRPLTVHEQSMSMDHIRGLCPQRL